MRSRHTMLFASVLLAWQAIPALDAAPAPVSVAASDPSVVIVRLEGPLDEAWASILRRAEEEVRVSQAGTFVLSLDSPGGEIELMKRLGDRLDSIGDLATTICFVNRRALSAGAWMAMSCSQIYLAPTASLGAAMPITVGPGGIMPELDDDVREKMNSAFRAEFRSWAEAHQRDGRVAEAFVDRDVELKRVSVGGTVRLVNGREHHDLVEQGKNPRFLETVCGEGELLTLTTELARELGFCEGVSQDLDGVLLALGLGNAPQVRVEATWSESLVLILGRWSWLLMLASAFFLVVSFNMPGLGAPEVAAALTMAVYLFHGWLVGLAEWTEVLFIVAGFLLVMVELFLTPGTLIAGAFGALLLLAGLLLSMQNFVLPTGLIEENAFRHNVLVLLATLLGAPLLGAFVMRRLVNTRFGSFLAVAPRSGGGGSVVTVTPQASAETDLTGSLGQCRTPLRPAGTVLVEGVPYDAVSTGDFLEAGTQVRVLGRQGPSLLVQSQEEPL